MLPWGLYSTKNQTNTQFLSGILEMEYTLGYTNSKVAGDKGGVTSLQTEIKVEGVTMKSMRIALAQAKVGRCFILDGILKIVAAAQSNLPSALSKIERLSISVHRVEDMLGQMKDKQVNYRKKWRRREPHNQCCREWKHFYCVRRSKLSTRQRKFRPAFLLNTKLDNEWQELCPRCCHLEHISHWKVGKSPGYIHPNWKVRELQ